MICYIAGNFEAGNSLNLAIMAVVGQHYGLVRSNDADGNENLTKKGFKSKTTTSTYITLVCTFSSNDDM